VTVPVALDCASTPAAARTEITERRITERILKDGKCEVVDIYPAVWQMCDTGIVVNGRETWEDKS
jgi:hypothetical protein